VRCGAVRCGAPRSEHAWGLRTRLIPLARCWRDAPSGEASDAARRTALASAAWSLRRARRGERCVRVGSGAHGLLMDSRRPSASCSSFASPARVVKRTLRPCWIDNPSRSRSRLICSNVSTLDFPPRPPVRAPRAANRRPPIGRRWGHFKRPHRGHFRRRRPTPRRLTPTRAPRRARRAQDGQGETRSAR
jgi:hypothetical protein